MDLDFFAGLAAVGGGRGGSFDQPSPWYPTIDKQCDLIGRFIVLWATFQSIWQQLFA